jgi:hypothetical protein
MFLPNCSSGTDLTAKDCLRSLSFPELGLRQQSIASPLTNTCDWLFQVSRYRDWHTRQAAENFHGMLWIKGKPGAGKSTLMKEALLRSKRTLIQDKNIAGFFFNARGSRMERTPLGFFRAILHELLQEDRELMAKFLKLYRLKRDTISGEWQWQQGDVQGFLYSLFDTPGVRQTFFFVDGLDECDEKNVRDVVYYLRQLTDNAFKKGNELNVCISSRHYPTITIQQCPEIIVEGGNTEDIQKYIQTKMTALQAEESIADLRGQILSKANGIFLWVVIVVEILLKDWDNGKTAKEMEKTLRKVPSQLSQLFETLFQSLKADERPAAVTLFQLVLLTDRRWDPQQLCCALAFSSQRSFQSLQACYDAEGPMSDIQCSRRIRNLSRGLVEVKGLPSTLNQNDSSQEGKNDASANVQFIHETVRELFMHENGFAILDNSLKSTAIGDGHCTVLRTCFNILSVHEFKLALEKELRELPLSPRIYRLGLCSAWALEYTPTRLFYHASQIESNVVAPLELVQRLHENKYYLWNGLQCLGLQSGERVIFADSTTLYTTLLYALCTRRLPLCVKALLALDSADLNTTVGPYRYPLIAAVIEDDAASVCALLQSGADVHVKDEFDQTALHHAARRGSAEVAGVLLDHGSSPGFVDTCAKTPLHYAAEYAPPDTVRLLIDHGYY